MNAGSKKIIVMILFFALCPLFFSGCSCSSKEEPVKVSPYSSRQYDADASDEGFRTKSMMKIPGSNGQLKYLGKRSLKRGEKSPELEKLLLDGQAALQNKSFREAETLLSNGNYAEALKSYEKACNTSQNTYIERRTLACKNSIDRVAATENADLKKASSFLLDGHPDEALNILNGLDRGDSGDNTFLRQNVSAMKLKAYDQLGDTGKFAQEYLKQDNISRELGERLSRSWVVPIER